MTHAGMSFCIAKMRALAASRNHVDTVVYMEATKAIQIMVCSREILLKIVCATLRSRRYPQSVSGRTPTACSGQEQSRITGLLEASLFPMKKLLLSLLTLGAVLATTSVSVKADEDRSDHNWNDEYWHNNHEGYWHGHKGHWAYHHHKHTFIEAGPVTIETH